ncbi:transposase, partial [Weissella cibaria]|uniref:transposase n=1 Tax=Weissella cibaria TaxID=137591 RepID=UPI001AD98166
VAQALTGQRVADQRSIEDTRYSREYAIMKSQWRLFMKSYDKLNQNTRVYLAGVKELMTAEEALNLVFRSFPTLHATWLTYQAVLEAIHEQNMQKFSDILVAYSPLRNSMDTAISTFSKNLDGVLES